MLGTEEQGEKYDQIAIDICLDTINAASLKLFLIKNSDELAALRSH
jgi:hypothetical protein